MEIHSLMKIEAAIPALNIRNHVPNEKGLYSIFVRDIEILPEQMKNYQLEKALLTPQLIYIGKASGENGLKERLADQDLQHKNGSSTFFRSIGAALGFRPIPASLKYKANKQNFRFSLLDTEDIREWMNINLLVNFIILSDWNEEQIRNSENQLINEFSPVCNIDHNPTKLKWLLDCREECKRIARG